MKTAYFTPKPISRVKPKVGDTIRVCVGRGFWMMTIARIVNREDGARTIVLSDRERVVVYDTRREEATFFNEFGYMSNDNKIYFDNIDFGYCGEDIKIPQPEIVVSVGDILETTNLKAVVEYVTQHGSLVLLAYDRLNPEDEGKTIIINHTNKDFRKALTNGVMEWK